MKTTIFLFHPNLKESLINAALINNANTEVRNIYGLYPDGNIDIHQEQEALSKIDRIVLQFPMYWYSVPPLMKKWEDLVLEHGWAYGSKGHALDNKEILIAVSTGARLSDYQPGSVQNHTINEYLLPLFATFATTRMTILQPFITDGGIYITDPELQKRAAEYQQLLTKDQLPRLKYQIL
ncbi:NAD(P)H-dependent oxidoreductase [Limosilactobacillus sp. STM2_1]|uniref:NAD(P)H-dependent oxidoreductase n=1 Tax=Limosilactobacillus rudii TaxID=2759755 RepID=A0A7W3UJC4_9LACO|nr:NAD(P)H-dependent oxidoreductase [Limosilactobacillus rudii]MBB1078492.1 NAD(P)H-dependent oxidoreductase [Limosilactobacillus rudii]MBB1096622.1 NAD(P)H-dependent oxidoreductase [Limosilactobacillus rudii]MCD7134183.1 NAD(P)H-dependent oxidoreductase [Limosilactobacillus rudii]